MPVSFDIGGCAVGGCTACGGCVKMPPKPYPATTDYDPSKAPGQVATVLVEQPNVTYYTQGKLHTPVVVTFSFSDFKGANFAENAWSQDLADNTFGVTNNWRSLTTNFKLAMMKAADYFSSVSGLKLVYVEDYTKADIAIHYGEMNKYLGSTAVFAADPMVLGSDILFNTDYALALETTGLSPGDKGYAVLLHEFGHAVGLKHPFFGTYQLPATIENRSSTVMSHNEDPNGTFRSALTSLDISGLRYIYGTLEDRAAKDIEWKQLSGGGLVSIGGNANDTIQGIKANDYVLAGAGDDVVASYEGDDIINGGTGTNILLAGAGRDLVEVNALASDKSSFSLVYWNAGGSINGVLTRRDGTDYVSQIEGLRFADGAAWFKTETQPKITTEQAITNLYHILFGIDPFPNNMQDGLNYLASGHSFTELVAVWLPYQPFTGLTIPQILQGAWDRAQSTGTPVPQAMIDWAMQTGDLASMLAMFAQSKSLAVNTLAPSGLSDVTSFEVDSTATHISQLFTLISGHAPDAATLQTYTRMAELDGVKLSGIAKQIASDNNLTLTDDQISKDFVTFGIPQEAAPQPVIYSLETRDQSLGFDKITNDFVIGYRPSGHIQSVTVSTDHVVQIVLPANEGISTSTARVFQLLDGVLTVGGASEAAVADSVYRAIVGKGMDLSQTKGFSSQSDVDFSKQHLIDTLFGSTDLLQKVNSMFAGYAAKDFVASTYRLLMGDNPTSEWVSKHVALVDSGMDRGEFIERMLSDHEVWDRFQAPKDGYSWAPNKFSMISNQFFDGAFNRLSGETDYPHLLKMGYATESFAHDIFYSAEATGIHRTDVSDDNFIRAQFQYSMGRQPDQAELTTWLDKLHGGMDKSQVLMVLSLSDEAKHTQGYVENAYVGPTWPGHGEVSSASVAQAAPDLLHQSGNGASDVLMGTKLDDSLSGGDGDDNLVGGSGNDTLDGGKGNDWLEGGNGNDTYYVDSQRDVVNESVLGGNDTVHSTADLYLYDNVENLVLEVGSAARFGVGNATDNNISGNEFGNLLISMGGNDIVSGNDGADTIFGMLGDDSLDGGNGNDYLFGGEGNDVIQGGNGADILYGEAGNDSIVGGSDFSFDLMVGGDGNDTIDGASGLGDFDYLYGGTGDDTFYVDTPFDLVFEFPGEGTDTVFANIVGAGYYLYADIENLTLLGTTPFGVGNALDNVLTGSASTNWLLGGAGNDTINGKGGDDVLFGQAGKDTFVVEKGNGSDVIGDFTPGEDHIDLIGYGIQSFSSISAAGVQYGKNTLITLPGGETLTLNDVSISQLRSSDFLF